jgi:hypothetical protein
LFKPANEPINALYDPVVFLPPALLPIKELCDPEIFRVPAKDPAAKFVFAQAAPRS